MRTSVPATWLLVLGVLSCCAHLQGQMTGSPSTLPDSSPKIRLLNTKIFGHSADDAVVLLQPNDGSKVDPEYVLTDIKGGRYYAATVCYPPTLTVDDVPEEREERGVEQNAEGHNATMLRVALARMKRATLFS